MKLKDWFLNIAADLNDAEPGHEFASYSLNSMVAAYNRAMCLVAKYRPDIFTELRIVKLHAGTYQDVRGCCTAILGVLDQTGPHGETIRELDGGRDTTVKVKRTWKKASCAPRPAGAPGGYIIENVHVDPNLNSRFKVFPPVPCDVDVYVRVKCVNPPCPVDATHVEKQVDAACDHMTAAYHYVLASMLAGDRFANGASAKAQNQYRMFFEILGIVLKQEDMFEAPERAAS